MDIGLNWNEWHQEAARKPYVRVGVTLLSGALILMLSLIHIQMCIRDRYDAALFCCDRNEIKAYMLRRLKPGLGGGKTTFVTVDEVANAHMKELALVYPVLNEDKAKEADAMFCKFIQSVFDKRIVSSVFLTGEGFENKDVYKRQPYLPMNCMSGK